MGGGVAFFANSGLAGATRPLVFLAIFLLSACARSFAPPYDPAIVTSFYQANEKALVLFSSVSHGSPASAYPSYAERYDEVVGAFDALRLQAEARPSSELPAGIRDRVCKDVPADTCTNNPSPVNLAELISNLETLRQKHATRGLTPDYVLLRKLDHDIYARHILVIEEYLKSE